MNGADCTIDELALAMHLYSIWSKSSEKSAGKWVEIARECLRQMEWTSRQNRTITETIDCSQYPGMRGVRILGKKPLTLAPDDWSGDETDARYDSFTRRDRSTTAGEAPTSE